MNSNINLTFLVDALNIWGKGFPKYNLILLLNGYLRYNFFPQ